MKQIQIIDVATGKVERTIDAPSGYAIQYIGENAHMYRAGGLLIGEFGDKHEIMTGVYLPIARKLDDLGRICLPKALRDALRLDGVAYCARCAERVTR